MTMETRKWRGLQPAGQRAGFAFMTSSFKTPGADKGPTDRRTIIWTVVGSAIVGAISYHLYVTTQKTAKSRNVGINVYKDHVRGKGNGGGGQ
ncbi:hypothetical protein EMCRGX_G033269 [Ephydatia muelleri]|eukprot:Em0022g59a